MVAIDFGEGLPFIEC